MRTFLTLAAAGLAVGNLSSAPTDDGIYAVFETTRGDFTAALFYQQSPLSCANFIGLSEGSIPSYENGLEDPIHIPFYDGLSFHSIERDSFIQSGDPGNETGGPGYRWPDEASPTLSHEAEGILSMSNSGPNSNGSQFFITLAASTHLDGLHNVFGRVVEGIEIVRAIGASEVDEANAPLDPITIERVTILTIGESAAAFDAADYAAYFDPTVGIFGANVPSQVSIDEAAAGTISASVDYAPLTNYHFDWSEDLMTWNEFALAIPSMVSAETPASVSFTPEAPGEGDFVRVYATRGGLIDVHRIFERIEVSSPSDDGTFLETIAFDELLEGNYSSGTQDFRIEYDWYGINEYRTQILIYFPEADAETPIIQFFLDWSDGTSGSVYINDSISEFVGQGTFQVFR